MKLFNSSASYNVQFKDQEKSTKLDSEPSSVTLVKYKKIDSSKSLDGLNSISQKLGTSQAQKQGQSLERSGSTSPQLQLSTLASSTTNTLARRVIASDLQVICDKFTAAIKPNSIHGFDTLPAGSSEKEQKTAKLMANQKSQAIQTLSHDIAPLLTKYKGSEGKLSVDDTATISLAFEKLTKQLPEGNTKELSRLLAQHIKSDWMQIEKDNLREGQLAKLKPLGKPGASMSTTYSAGFNAGGSLLAVPGSEAKIGPYVDASVQGSYTTKLSPDDEGIFYERKIKGVNLGLKGGVQASVAKDVGVKAELGGKVKYSFANIRFWNNVEGYVDKEGHKLNAADRQQQGKTSIGKRIELFFKNQIPFRPGSELKRFTQEQQLAANNRPRLNQLLKTELGIDAKVNAPSPVRVVPLAAVSHTWTGAASLTGSAGTSFDVGALTAKANVGLSATAQKSVTNLHWFIPQQLADVIKNNKKRLNELPSNFTKHAHELMHKAMPETAIHGLKKLEQDVEKYFDVVKQYDALKSAPNVDKSELNKLRQEKHQIEDKWGAVGRHQFLQFTTASHALFTSIIMPGGTLSSDVSSGIAKDTTDMIGRTALKVQSPEIEYSKKRLDKIAKFEKIASLKISDTSSNIKLSVGPFSGQLNILQRDFAHPNRVREGKYFDVTLTGTVFGSAQSLFKGATLTAEIQKAAAGQGITLPGDLNISPDLGAGASISRTIRFFKPKYSQAEDFSGEKGWRKQFVRDTGNLSTNVSLGLSGTVAPGAHAGANIGVSTSKTTVVGETIGTDDLTYTETRFNRFFKAGGQTTANTDWQNFFKENQTQYKEIFKNLANKEHGIQGDTQHAFNELLTLAPEQEKDNITQLQTDFFKAMDSFRADEESNPKFELAKQHFESYLEQLVKPWWNAHVSRWENTNFTQGADSGLDLGTRIAKGLGIHSRI